MQQRAARALRALMQQRSRDTQLRSLLLLLLLLLRISVVAFYTLKAPVFRIDVKAGLDDGRSIVRWR